MATGTSRTNAPRANSYSGAASMSPEEYMRMHIDSVAKLEPRYVRYAGKTEESVYNAPDVSATLAERGGRYGKFIDHSQISQGMQDVMRAAPNWDKLDVDMRQALTTIVDKIARILNGDPYYDDSWHDISGYATLVERRLLEEKAPQ